MNEQPDLFGHPPPPPPARYPHAPGHRGVPISIIAAEMAKPCTGRWHKRILAFLEQVGARGAIYTEIMAGTGISCPSLCGRMVELRAAGHVVMTNETRQTPSNRPASVYKLARYA